jgi:acyl CoA:acetate/3-ketoacid CoA transferase alpha subunit
MGNYFGDSNASRCILILEKTLMNTLSARIAAAAVGLTMLVTTSAFAKPPVVTHVKSTVRHMKNGKTVAVKAYTRKAHGVKKTVTVKSSVRHLKNGKTIAVKSFTRKVVAHKAAKKMKK